MGIRSKGLNRELATPGKVSWLSFRQKTAGAYPVKIIFLIIFLQVIGCANFFESRTLFVESPDGTVKATIVEGSIEEIYSSLLVISFLDNRCVESSVYISGKNEGIRLKWVDNEKLLVSIPSGIQVESPSKGINLNHKIECAERHITVLVERY